MDGKRLERVNRLIQKELGDIFQKELKPKVPSLMITVTRVNVTSDLSYARVYLSVFGVDDKKKVVEEVAQTAEPFAACSATAFVTKCASCLNCASSRTTHSTTSKTLTTCFIPTSETAAVHSKPLSCGQKKPQPY